MNEDALDWVKLQFPNLLCYYAIKTPSIMLGVDKINNITHV